MKRLLILLLALPAAASAQPDAPLLQSRPDVLIRVRKSSVGADYVEIHMVREEYPKELLEAQCARVAEELSAGLRGLVVAERSLGDDPESRAGRVVYASFATDGVIVGNGVLRLLPFARAFAGAPEPHTVRTLAVAFEGVTPTPGVTLQAADTPSATVRAQFDASLPQVEYRVSLKVQDPAQIDFPESAERQPSGDSVPSTERIPVQTLALVAVGGVLAGVLVYFALRPGRHRGRKPESRRPRL